MQLKLKWIHFQQKEREKASNTANWIHHIQINRIKHMLQMLKNL
jgi:hypothetical protein